jgi:hypothetical protein
MHTRLKKILLIGTMFTLLFSSFAAVIASEDPKYTDSFPLQTYDFRMYVVSLELNDTLIVNITSVADGDFDLFLFSDRPKEAHISRDGYDSEIINPSTLAYDMTQGGSFSSINFTAENPDYPDALYYLQVVLINNGPDSYVLEANHPMEIYFIPFIPGYPLYVIVAVSVLTIGIIFLNKRHRLIKK